MATESPSDILLCGVSHVGPPVNSLNVSILRLVLGKAHRFCDNILTRKHGITGPSV